MIICDEGHVLKNSKSAVAQSANRVNTRRRIVLTGSPLQNNLNEYHCMVSFVKPNLLGSIKEFRNRFVNPINNGHFADSTDIDVKIMKKRAHVLHKTLAGCVQRMDYTVIKPFIPAKQEFVVFIRLGELQQKLYKKYLERLSVFNTNLEKEAIAGVYVKNKGIQLLTDYQHLYRIWSHPLTLKMKFEELKKTNELKRVASNSLLNHDEDEYSSFCEEIESDEYDEERVSNTKPREFDLKIKNELFSTNEYSNATEQVTNDDKNSSTECYDKWWRHMIDGNEIENIELSGKMVLFFEILRLCEKNGEKLILFSQSILTLNLIENFLKKMTSPLVDYFRIDGETHGEDRNRYINMFNDENNHVRLFLIR